MKLPVSFEEVAYFNNEYRGDLIVMTGRIYYFPHTRVKYARHDNDALGGRDTAEAIGLAGALVPLAGTAPFLYGVANNSVKFARFLRRAFRPSMGSPEIRKSGLWHPTLSDEKFQQILDDHIVQSRGSGSKFEDDSVPKPRRFLLEDVENLKVGMKLTFDALYDNHDFRINLLHRGKLKAALREGGFIKD